MLEAGKRMEQEDDENPASTKTDPPTRENNIGRAQWSSLISYRICSVTVCKHKTDPVEIRASSRACTEASRSIERKQNDRVNWSLTGNRRDSATVISDKTNIGTNNRMNYIAVLQTTNISSGIHSSIWVYINMLCTRRILCVYSTIQWYSWMAMFYIFLILCINVRCICLCLPLYIRILLLFCLVNI